MADRRPRAAIVADDLTKCLFGAFLIGLLMWTRICAGLLAVVGLLALGLSHSASEAQSDVGGGSGTATTSGDSGVIQVGGGGSTSPEGPATNEPKVRVTEPLPMLAETAVRLAPGTSIEVVAETHGATLEFPIGGVSGWWLLKWPDVARAEGALAALRLDGRVLDVLPQRSVRRATKLNDAFFAQQWHLENTGVGAGTDLNVVPAWNRGLDGSGVLIAVLDNGVQWSHPDLAPNWQAAESYDYLGNDPDPSPVGSDDHGTACAGLVAARGDNSIGVAGVAYEARLAGIRIVGSGQTDAREASAIGHLLQAVQVSSNSWGPADNGQYEAPGPLALAAFQNGVANGRGGRGVIYVWAAGNGGTGDWSNKDGFANLPETIAVSAINRNGIPPTYAEGGANILISGMAGSANVVTTDLVGVAGSNSGFEQNNLTDGDYTNDFSGTSAATPMISGVAALMLQANPDLDWRSVQHILVRTAERVRPLDIGWRTNGAGVRFHHRHGAGLADADAATALAAQWIGVPPRESAVSAVDTANVAIPDNSTTGVTRTIDFTESLFLEHVVVRVTFDHTFWGDLEVILTAPSGMTSTLAAHSSQASAIGPVGSQSWDFLTVRHWGESSQGTWTLRVNDRLPQDAGSLVSWQITAFGTSSAIGANGGAAPVGAPSISNVAPNPIVRGGTITVSGTNLVANPTLTASVGGVAQEVLSSSVQALVLRLSAETPFGSQLLVVNNGVASVSSNVSVAEGGGGGGGGCMLVRSNRGGPWVWVVLLVLAAVVRGRRSVQRPRKTATD